MSDLENQFLKDPQTLTIFPAPTETREEGISWYEVQVRLSELALALIAFDNEGAEVERADIMVRRPSGDLFRFDANFSKQDQGALGANISVERTSESGLSIKVNFGSNEFSITGTSTEPESVQSSDTLSTEIPKHWGRLTDSLEVLAKALSVRAIDSNSWGCHSCIVLGSALLMAIFLCAEGAVPACVAALAMGATFYENCEGACSWEDQSG